MVVKINKKPIQIVDPEEQEKDFSIVYFSVSCAGYFMALWILDYVCSVFFFHHPFPFISTVAKFIGGVLAWIF